MNFSTLLPEGDCNHFMTKRFDRTDDGAKIHMQTAAGLAHLDRDTRRSKEIISEITDVVAEWESFAKDCGVRESHRKQIQDSLLLKI